MPATVRQVENALALLEFFAARKRPATLADVAGHFGWPRSSTFNLLATLAEGGWLYEPRARGGYYPTPRWQALAGEIAEGEPAPERLAALVRRVAEETGETVWASAPSGLHAVFLEVAESPAGIRYAARQGARVPIHLTASGQALLSQMPERDREAILRKAGFEARGPAAARDLAEVRAQIAAGRARGWFRSASYWSADLGGVSIPVVVGAPAGERGAEGPGAAGQGSWSAQTDGRAPGAQGSAADGSGAQGARAQISGAQVSGAQASGGRAAGARGSGGRVFSLTVAGPLFRVEAKEEAHARLLHRAVAEAFGPDHAARTLTGMRVLT